MIKAKHNILIYPMFQWITRFLLWKSFKSIHIEGEFKDNGKAVFLIVNHISWWDGFWLMYLNLKLFHRKFYFMMLEQQLIKHWYFQYSGAYSVKKNSRSIIESIDYTNKLLSISQNMVFIFPQGKITSIYNTKVHFEKGVQKIINLAEDNVQVVFIANLLDYFSNSKLNLFMHLKVFLAKDLKGRVVEFKYNEFYEDLISKHNTKTS